MIAEIFLGLLAVAELICFVLYVHESNKEKSKLVNALIAKDAQELTNLTLADQTTIKPEVTKPDIMPFEEMDDEQFDKHIQDELNG